MTFTPKTIFVPVAVASGDDMPLAETVVDAAIGLARGAGGKVVIAYVDPLMTPMVPLDIGLLPGDAIETMYKVRDANRDIAKKNLHVLTARATAAGIDATSEVIEATMGIGETIAARANELKADLIAVCSHSRRGVKRLFLGSVAERVGHLATVPVLIVRAPST